MKRFLYGFFSLIILSLFALPAQAATYTSISIGSPPKQYDWLQGVEAIPGGFYVMDGTTIKKVINKKVSKHFDLQQLKQVLPKHLNTPAIINTFLLTQMTEYKGELYVSGLVYKNTENERKMMNRQLVAGETHTVLFSISKNKPQLIHTNLAYHNKKHQFGDFYETPNGLPGNMWSRDDGSIVVAFGRYVNKPRFSITNSGEVIFATQKEGEPPTLFMDVYKYKNKQKKLLYTQQVYDDQYFIPTLKGNLLTVYYEISNQYDDYNIRVINLDTKQVVKKMVPDDLKLEKPLQISGHMYFLNSNGVFKIWDEGKFMNMKWIMKAEELPLSVWIPGWDYDGKYLYIADFDRRVVHQIIP